MRFRPALPLLAVGLALSSSALAQTIPAAAAPPPAPPAAGPANGHLGSQTPMTTQASRIRAFNAGPDGQVRSLYLQNGSVVDVSPALGGQLSTQARKGARIRVTGTRTIVNGQQIILADTITMNSQTYEAQLQGTPNGQAGLGPNGARGMMAPLPPPPTARLDAPGGPGSPRPAHGPVPPPPSGPDSQAGTRTQGAPPPPPKPGAPLTPQNGPQQRNTPPPPPPPAQGTPAAAPEQPNPRTPQSPDANSSAPAPAPSL